jgi:malate dehydrogenase (oxaloacetate-decarboxylating)(NADP+)
VFADAENSRILKVAQLVVEEGVGYPILLGDEKRIRRIAANNNIDLEDMPIIDPKAEDTEELRKQFGELFYIPPSAQRFQPARSKQNDEGQELLWMYAGRKW